MTGQATTWVDVALSALNVMQTILLAFLAARSHADRTHP